MRLLLGTDQGLFAPDGRVELDGQRVDALAVDGPSIYAIVDGHEIVRRHTETWSTLDKVAERANCLLPLEDGLLVGTAEAGLLRVDGDDIGAVAGFQAIEGRAGWYTPWGGPPDSRSAARSSDGTLYVNVHVGGIPRSVDGGAHWTPTIDVHADVHEVATHPDMPELVLAATARGLAVSRDRGDSWRFEAEGLHGRYARAVAAAGEVIYLTASTGSSSRQAAVYRKRLDADEPFRRCVEGLPEWFAGNINTHCLAVSGDRVAFGTATGSVFESSDRGGRWEAVASDLSPVRCVAYAP